MNQDVRLDINNKAKSNTWLNDFAKSVTSQGGEDGIIGKILSVIKNTNKWCVEFGSWQSITEK